MTGSSKSNQEVSNRIQMSLQAIGPLSRLSLAKKMIAKDVTHIHGLEKCFGQCYSASLSSIGLILEGNSLTVILIAHFWFHFDGKLNTIKAGFHMIADDRGSRIADRKKFCDRLRSYGNTLLRSSAISCDRTIIWKPKFCDLRSKRIP